MIMKKTLVLEIEDDRRPHEPTVFTVEKTAAGVRVGKKERAGKRPDPEGGRDAPRQTD